MLKQAIRSLLSHSVLLSHKAAPTSKNWQKGRGSYYSAAIFPIARGSSKTGTAEQKGGGAQTLLLRHTGRADR